MDTLSLRVSSIKSTENLKKNSEIKISILKLPKKYSFNQHDCIVEFVNKFNEFTSCEQQVLAIQSLVTKLPNCDVNDLEVILQLIADIFFASPPKHPIRCSILRIIQKQRPLQPTIQMCLTRTVHEHIENLRHTPSSIHNHNNVIIALSGLFEIHTIGKHIIGKCLAELYHLVDRTLTLYTDELRQPYSPAEKCEIFLFIHSAIRLAIFSSMPDYESSSMPILATIRTHCRRLIDIDDVPMDTKVNCGILTVKSETDDAILLRLAEIQQNKYAADPLFNVCLYAGIISCIPGRITVSLIEKFALLNAIGMGLVTAPLQRNLFENDQSLLLTVCRCLCQLTKFLHSSAVQIGANDQILLEICLDFVDRFHDHYMDSVRHLCKDLLRNLFQLDDTFQSDHSRLANLIDGLACVSAGTLQRLLFECCVRVYGSEQLVSHFSDDLPAFLLQKLVANPEWLTCYETVMTNHSLDVDVHVWYQRWIQPILFHSKIGHDFVQVNEQLISRAITYRPEVIASIFAERNELPIETYLFVMWTIRMNGRKEFVGWKPAADKIVRLAKFHTNDDIRIMSLKILVDVHKTTEQFSGEEFTEILAFLRYNCNCQSPAMRGKIISYMRKALQRIAAGYAVAKRQQNTVTCLMYQQFLVDLIEFCVTNVATGANFSRRSISLNLLSMAITSCGNLVTFEFPFDSVWSAKMITKLIENLLEDTYEANKSLVVEILSQSPRAMLHTVPFYDLTKIATLTISIKPGDSVTAAYYLKLCCMAGVHFDSSYAAALWCEALLLDGLKTAEKSLLLAARQNPLYGCVFCISHLLSKIDFVKVDPTSAVEWRTFFARFIQTCKRLTDVVSPIVNSSSPEGHLPNDFSDVSKWLPNEQAADDEATCEKPNKILSSRNTDGGDRLKTTPQMVLLCAWRTTRDVSLLLGELSLRLPIYGGAQTAGLITIDEILDIGEHFQKLLSETKHRGGFEQAYVGFSKLCVRLWRSPEKRLHERPMRWLAELIELISSTDLDAMTKREKLCATRRSAGVPFIIQALITSELQVFSMGGLHYCVRKLIDLCRECDVAELRTHGLNILRALFRCSDLGDAVGEYIAEAIECSIMGYNAVTWPERNSATLLFSALMIRIFGVQRTRNTEPLGIRNKMTGRIFFLKFPRLYDFISQQLTIASESIQHDERPTTLHPLLILLSRLYPSALEGSESNLQMSAFLPALSECTKSPELETRRLAVKSIVALVQPNHVVLYSLEIVKLLKNHLSQPIKNSNISHGYLLQLYALVESMPIKNATKSTEIHKLLADMLNVNLLTCNNFVLTKTYADTLNEIIIRSTRTYVIQLNAEHKIDAELDPILAQKQSVHIVGLPEAMKSCVRLKMLLTIDTIQQNGGTNADYLLYQSIAGKSFEYIKTVLTAIEMILRPTQREYSEFSDFVSYLTTQEIAALQMGLRDADTLKTELYRLIDTPIFFPYCTIACYSVLCELPVDCRPIEELCQLLVQCDGMPDEVKEIILKYVMTRLHKHRLISTKFIAILLPYIQQMSQPNCLNELRLVAAQFVCHIVNNWSDQIQSQTMAMQLFGILFTLVSDDDSDVRDIIAELVVQHRPAKCISHRDVDTDLKGIDVCVSTVAEELIFNFINGRFEMMCAELDVPIWRLWVELLRHQLRAFQSNGTNYLDDEMEVFDKNESNVYAEPVLVCKRIYEHLKNVVPRNCANEIGDNLEAFQRQNHLTLNC